MNQPAKAQEPSMEEILASIRRIIADDDTAKPAPKPAPVAAAPKPAPQRPPVPPAPPPEPPVAHFEPPPPPEPEEDILDLTEQMAETSEEPPSFQTIDGQNDVVFADPQPEPAPPPPPPRQVYTPPPQQQPAERLISASTSAAVDSAFNTLAQTVLVQNARTLEDLVREMLRPMLKGWLDDNLPSMVEGIVKAEIERVSRGRG